MALGGKDLSRYRSIPFRLAYGCAMRVRRRRDVVTEDGITKRAGYEVIYDEIPCRVSRTGLARGKESANTLTRAPNPSEYALVVYLDKSYKINKGDRIDCYYLSKITSATDEEMYGKKVNNKYIDCLAGEPRSYDTHQEIEIYREMDA